MSEKQPVGMGYRFVFWALALSLLQFVLFQLSRLLDARFGLWFSGAALVIAGVFAAVTVYEARLLRRRLAAGLCPGCGYDLRASKDRCPECGREIDAKSQSK